MLEGKRLAEIRTVSGMVTVARALQRLELIDMVTVAK